MMFSSYIGGNTYDCILVGVLCWAYSVPIPTMLRYPTGCHWTIRNRCRDEPEGFQSELSHRNHRGTVNDPIHPNRFRVLLLLLQTYSLVPPGFAFVVTFSTLIVPTIVWRTPKVTITSLSIMSYLFGIILVGNVDELFIVTALNLITVVFPIVLCTHILTS
jgi:hypothetical protein